MPVSNIPPSMSYPGMYQTPPPGLHYPGYIMPQQPPNTYPPVDMYYMQQPYFDPK